MRRQVLDLTLIPRESVTVFQAYLSPLGVRHGVLGVSVGKGRRELCRQFFVLFRFEAQGMLNAAAPVVRLTTELLVSLFERSRQFAIRGGRPLCAGENSL